MQSGAWDTGWEAGREQGQTEVRSSASSAFTFPFFPFRKAVAGSHARLSSSVRRSAWTSRRCLTLPQPLRTPQGQNCVSSALVTSRDLGQGGGLPKPGEPSQWCQPSCGPSAREHDSGSDGEGLWAGLTLAGDTVRQGQDAHPLSQQRLLCLSLTSTCLPQPQCHRAPRPPYLIKVQNAEEVLCILLGNLDSFLCSHTAVTRQAVAQKYLGISQLMEFSFLQKKDDLA